MTKKKQAIPEYLEELQKSGPIESGDNFGPEDVIWTGGEVDEAGNTPVDPDLIIDEQGQDPYPPLRYLMLMLAAGQGADLDQDEIHRRARRAYYAIVGDAPEGAPRKHRYHEARHEIAWQVYVALYESHFRMDKKEAKIIVRKVLEEQFPNLADENNVVKKGLVKTLCKDLDENWDLYLVRATSDDDYDRMDVWRALKSAAASLERAGISINFDATGPTRLAKNQT